MKRNSSNKSTCRSDSETHKKRIAAHEAGHAVAIIVNNKINKLPPVCFQISFNDIPDKTDSHSEFHLSPSLNDDYSAEVNGGMLINNFTDSLSHFSDKLNSNLEKQKHRVDDYLKSFETDIVNLLAGPLAEAKLVAITDDEDFHRNLIFVDALHHYGGTSDIALVNEYLENFSTCINKKNTKLVELYNQAFDFVDNLLNWEKIMKLSQHILDNDIKTIDNKEINSVINE